MNEAMSMFLAPVVPLSGSQQITEAHIGGAVQGRPTATPGANFSDMVSEGIQRVSDGLIDSQAQVQSLVSGDAQNLHQVMLKLEESKLSFHLFLQVRNRLLESYQEVMRMQV